MKVLVACEFSGIVRNAFLARGHDAYSCDLLPTSQEPKDRHIRGDVTELLEQPWDLVIAHPPCTYLCQSGVRWLKERAGRYSDMIEGCMFFRKCLAANSPRVAVENPVMHGHAARLVETKWTQTIQPWQFGHGEIKRTCLWLKGLLPLQPTKEVPGRYPKSHLAPRNKYQWAVRSLTYTGIAQAMAEQWG